MSTTDGITAAVEDAAGTAVTHRGLGMFPDAVQLTLLRDENDGKIDAHGLRQLRTGPGRRPGSRNKRNAKTAKLIVDRYGDPLDALGNFAAMPLEDAVALLRHADEPDGDDADKLFSAVALLAQGMSEKKADELQRALIKYLGRKQISALDVAQMQVRVQQDLMTYVHGRQPVSVEVREKTDAVVIIPGINAPTNVSQAELQKAINERGLDAIDFERMQLVAPPVEGEFVEVAEGEDD